MKPEHYIHQLAQSFPCLRNKIPTRLWDEFDPNHFKEQMAGWSSGEYNAGLFILNVWNPGYARARNWHFDAVLAIESWDQGNRFAFTAWCLKPYFP